MGLSSSQARLLTLTSRQHSLECDAQRLLANKLRLANESDKLYQKYNEALDETTLKTLYTNTATGANYWVDGSLNNLLRYNAGDDSAGTTFFVQKMDDGKLYLPASLGNKYDAVVAGGQGARAFAESFGIIYRSVDHNKEMLTNYTNALNNGWDKLLGNNASECAIKYNEYMTANEMDANVKGGAYGVLSSIPSKKDGFYKVSDYDLTKLKSFYATVGGVLDEGYVYDIYSDTERKLMSSAVLLVSQLEPEYPEDTTEVDGHKTTTKSYRVSKVSASSGATYIERSSDRYNVGFRENDLYMMMLNGGLREVISQETTYISYDSLLYGSNSQTTTERNDGAYNIYGTVMLQEGGANVTVQDLLNRYSSEKGTTFYTLGDALKSMFTEGYNSTYYVDEFYAVNGLTNEDIKHYEAYLDAKAECDMYTPDIEFVPNDSVKAKYYEQMFEAIQAAGGWEALDDERAKNASWVTNMVKSAQVILTTWDDENKILSKTSGTLHTNLREQTNQLKINTAEQEFETELEKVNQKDARIDKKLSQLETERSAISSEISSIKTIIKANIETNFKLFS